MFSDVSNDLGQNIPRGILHVVWGYSLDGRIHRASYTGYFNAVYYYVMRAFDSCIKDYLLTCTTAIFQFPLTEITLTCKTESRSLQRGSEYDKRGGDHFLRCFVHYSVPIQRFAFAADAAAVVSGHFTPDISPRRTFTLGLLWLCWDRYEPGELFCPSAWSGHRRGSFCPRRG